jgi:hypothetical protein
VDAGSFVDRVEEVRSVTHDVARIEKMAGKAQEPEEGGPRKGEREQWSDERMKGRRRYVANVREQVRIETELEALSGARQAVKELKKLARGARDERARYSAAAKLVDIAMPKEAVPLVNLNIGTAYTSHLGLPPPPVLVMPPAVEVKALAAAPLTPIVSLPEPEIVATATSRDLRDPEIMPTQIGPEEPVSVEKIGPEDAEGRGFLRETIDIEARHSAPEVTKLEAERVTKPFSGAVKQLRERSASHPLARAFQRE